MMDIAAKINWVDVLILIVMIRMSYVAFQSGLSHEIFPLFGAIAIVILGLHYYHTIALYIQANVVKLPIELLDLIVFVIIALAAGFILKFVKAILDKLIKITWHPLIEKFGGLVIGAIRAAVTTSMILVILALIPLSYLQWSIRDKSMLGMHFFRIAPSIYAEASRVLPGVKMPEVKGESQGVGRDVIVNSLIADKSLKEQPATTGKKKRSGFGANWEETAR